MCLPTVRRKRGKCRLYKPPMYLVGGSEGSLLFNTSYQITIIGVALSSDHSWSCRMRGVTLKISQTGHAVAWAAGPWQGGGARGRSGGKMWRRRRRWGVCGVLGVNFSSFFGIFCSGGSRSLPVGVVYQCKQRECWRYHLYATKAYCSNGNYCTRKGVLLVAFNTL